MIKTEALNLKNGMINNCKTVITEKVFSITRKLSQDQQRILKGANDKYLSIVFIVLRFFLLGQRWEFQNIDLCHSVKAECFFFLRLLGTFLIQLMMVMLCDVRSTGVAEST